MKKERVNFEAKFNKIKIAIQPKVYLDTGVIVSIRGLRNIISQKTLTHFCNTTITPGKIGL